MDLNDNKSFSAIDKEDMLSEIDHLPDQINTAWDLGKSLSLPRWDGVQQVLVAGMGGSAIGADMLVSYISPHCQVPVVVNRDYSLPAWVKDQKSLVIACSHSGNTEETLSVYERAKSRNCRVLVITTGGKLAASAADTEAKLWTFDHTGQPRAAVGYSFVLLLSAFHHLGLVTDPSREIRSAVQAMRDQQGNLKAEIPIVNNPAKRLAGQLIGLYVTVIGADIVAPVARRIKGQISEIAKAWGQFEFLPEANHNTLAGISNPQEVLSRLAVIFIRSPSNHMRNLLRSNLTQRAFMLEGIYSDFIYARGSTPLSHLWTSLHFGDYLAYYLAMAYEVDPTPVVAIEDFKKEMKAAS